MGNYFLRNRNVRLRDSRCFQCVFWSDLERWLVLLDYQAALNNFLHGLGLADCLATRDYALLKLQTTVQVDQIKRNCV